MNKKRICILILLPFFLFAAGCSSYPSRPTPQAMVLTKCDGPITATINTNSKKSGKSSAIGILNLAAWGDASIQTAIESAGLKKIHHIDYNHFKIIIPYINLPVYEEYVTNVYGE